MTIWTRKELLDIGRIFGDSEKVKGNFINGDTCGLWYVNSRMPSIGSHEIHRDLTKRWKLMARIAECRREDGMMWVSESGRDCDGVQYSGSMHECEATLHAYTKLGYEINEWADGPFGIYPITEEEQKQVTYQSRDLAMEAFEDGHPHSLSSVRYDEEGEYS